MSPEPSRQGIALKEWRESLNLTQEKLAETVRQVCRVGFSVETVKNIEQGRTQQPDEGTKLKIRTFANMRGVAPPEEW